MNSLYRFKQASLVSLWLNALETPAFKRHNLNFNVLQAAASKSFEACCQRLIQALLREEIIPRTFIECSSPEGIWINLHGGNRLHLDNLSSGRMNSWYLKGSITFHAEGATPRQLVFPSQLLVLLATIFEQPVSAQVLSRFSEELDDSFMNDTLCVAFHNAWTESLTQQYGQGAHRGFLAALTQQPNINPTLLLEQWGTSGHPWHPNYKTKLGLSTEQVIGFSPEFDASYDVSFCALHRSCAHIEAIDDDLDYWQWLSSVFPTATEALQASLLSQGLNVNDYVALPVHPWQASETLPKLFANEIRDQLLVLTAIKAFTAYPTMSFRTVVPECCREAPMVKLPVALRLTSVQRTVSPRSACMGPRVSRLLLDILEREQSIQTILSILPESLGIHYKSAVRDDDRARHLAVLYRTNPLTILNTNEMAIPVGSLFALDQNGEPLLRQWVSLSEGADDENAVYAFLENYLSIAVQGLLSLYLLYGIAFEAHQQNSFMVMGTDQKPSRLLLRDFGDIRIDRGTLHSCGLDVETHDRAMTLYDNPQFVRDKLLHATFMCHLGELILLVARHWTLPQALLWNLLADQVKHCFDELRNRVNPQRWKTERQALLELDWPAKSFMRMRLLDSHIDLVGRLKNPLDATSNEV
ncbi:MAG TPA: IucA/IucC family protein [Pseudomonas sp.]|uniref:IucA/IucC family protein n=1 Tax=Pseudomonas sp. TaxID=306 RepID=UPI002EDB10A7